MKFHLVGCLYVILFLEGCFYFIENGEGCFVIADACFDAFFADDSTILEVHAVARASAGVASWEFDAVRTVALV